MISVLANPIVSEPVYWSPLFLPIGLAIIEGILLGGVLFYWTRRWSSFLYGFCVNTASLLLFWWAIYEDGGSWDWGYDFYEVAVGEILVVLIEGILIYVFLEKVDSVNVSSNFKNSLALSLLLNTVSFFMSLISLARELPSEELFGLGFKGANKIAHPTANSCLIPRSDCLACECLSGDRAARQFELT